ncbi:hypothetical protein, partial [Gemmiger sp.]
QKCTKMLLTFAQSDRNCGNLCLKPALFIAYQPPSLYTKPKFVRHTKCEAPGKTMFASASHPAAVA